MDDADDRTRQFLADIGEVRLRRTGRDSLPTPPPAPSPTRPPAPTPSPRGARTPGDGPGAPPRQFLADIGEVRLRRTGRDSLLLRVGGALLALGPLLAVVGFAVSRST